jgi:hypothetical protein
MKTKNQLEAIQNEPVSLKFNGQLHQVDAQVFINILVNFSEIIKEINKEQETKQNIKITISSTEKGSFIAFLDLHIIEDVSQLLSSPVGILADITAILTGIFTFRKWSSKKKIEKIEKDEKNKTVKITDENGDNILIKDSVFNIYQNNSAINDAISNSFATLNEDVSIDGFEIKTKADTFFANKSDFDGISTKIETINNDEKRVIVSANLIVNKIVFEQGNRKWEFIYRDNKISATINDEDFFTKINDGKVRFAKGDTLEVELEIYKILDKTVNAYLNKSYKVVKVIKHILRKNPPTLNISRKAGKKHQISIFE